MARKNTTRSEASEPTGEPTEVARGADVPLALASMSTATTRDALLDPREGDIIPDVESKGYHVGEVRQPAEPVLTSDGAVHFESDLDSKFEDGEGRSFIDVMKAAHNETDNTGEPVMADNPPLPTREEALGSIVASDEADDDTRAAAKAASGASSK
jgi:hypothetical protein